MSDIPENDTQGFPLACMCTHTHRHEKAAYLVKISNQVFMKICHSQKHIVGVLLVLTRKGIQCIWEENIFRTICKVFSPLVIGKMHISEWTIYLLYLKVYLIYFYIYSNIYITFNISMYYKTDSNFKKAKL